ncbi:MAG TPA: hypothetical protein PK978_00745 [Paludibacter sp.]|nr:hypothetical protein [Paludibacter sp.]HPM10095.1 hypothetical protein [Paludibacter sp.]
MKPSIRILILVVLGIVVWIASGFLLALKWGALWKYLYGMAVVSGFIGLNKYLKKKETPKKELKPETYKSSLLNNTNTRVMSKNTSIKLSNEYASINIGVVTEYSNFKHKKEYIVYDIKNPLPNVKLIGVKSGEVFALSFKTNLDRKYAVAIYLDGVNISQKNGIHSLNEIAEKDRSDYNKHSGIFIVRNSKDIFSYVDRYSQLNNANRLFTFTNITNAGINENLISDKSLESRIEIYAWVEKYIEEDIRFRFRRDDTPLFRTIREKNVDKIKIGAGEATYEKYDTTKGLDEPEYLGKAMFVYVNEEIIKHLGASKKYASETEFKFKDPMDLIPKT